MYVKYCVCALAVTLSGCLVNEVGQSQSPSDTEQDMQSNADMIPDLSADMSSDMVPDMVLDIGLDMVPDLSSDMGSLCGGRVCPSAKMCLDDGVLVARCVCPDGMRQDLIDPDNCVPMVVTRMCTPDLCKHGGECFLNSVSDSPDMMVPECRNCDEGYVGIEGGPGNFCTECQEGYSMQNGACLLDGPVMCDGVMCEGNKVCMNDAMGAGRCQCPDGLQDVDGDNQCERSCASYFPNVMNQCHGHGACVERAMNPRKGLATCECDEGYQPAPGVTSGPNCQACADQSFVYDMALEECVQLPPTCSPACGAGDVCVYDALNAPMCITPLHATCESHRLAGASADGFYALHVGEDSNKPWQAWCAGMQAPGPQEYLSLALEAPEDNVFMRTGSETTRTEPLQRRWTSTRYEMIRIDPVTFKVNIFDDTFTFTTSSQFDADFMTSVAEPVPFGMAQGCTEGLDVSDREPARGRINLTGLPFRTTGQMWSVGGRCASSLAPVFMDSGRVVTFDVNGGDVTQGCGVIVPDDGTAQGFATSFETGCGGAVTTPTNVYPPADPYQIQLAYDAALSVAPVVLPGSCREAKGLAPYPTTDGDYTLYHDADPNKPWTAYCKGMSTTNPVEYLTLPEQNNGSNHFKWGSFCNTAVDDTNAEISFQKVRIDPHTLHLDIVDQTYTAPIKPGKNGLVGLRYGHTRGCSVSCSGTDAGVGKVDLRGTPFVVTDPFYRWGGALNGGATFSSLDQVVDLSITGSCGEISPLSDGNFPGIDRKNEQRYMTVDFL